MTAESLKPFLTLPATTLKDKTNRKQIKCILFGAFIVICFVAISCIGIWNSVKTSELRQEVDQLKSMVQEMRKQLGFDLWDDLSEFEDAYKSPTDDEIYNEDDDEDEDEGGTEADDDDEGGGFFLGNDIYSPNSVDNSKFGTDRDSAEYFEQDLFAGSGYDSPTYMDEEMDDEDDGFSFNAGGFKSQDSSEYKDNYDDHSTEPLEVPARDKLMSEPHERKVRSIAGITEQGVPIMEEAYVPKRNRTRPNIDDYVGNVLLNNNQNHHNNINNINNNNNNNNYPDKEMFDWNDKIDIPSPLQSEKNLRKYQRNRHPHDRHLHHQQQQHQQQQHHHAAHHNNGGGVEAHPESINTNRHHNMNNLEVTTKEPEPIHSRRSRVMQTFEDKSKAFRQVIRKSDYAKMMAHENPNFLEQRQAPEQVVYPKRKVMRQLRRSMDAKMNGKQIAAAMHNIAVHYSADSSRVVGGYGNGKTKLSGNSYVDWNPAPWVNTIGMAHYFKMEEGIVTVKDSGLYFVYAQIFYHDDHDTNGFVIEHNSLPILQCTAMTHTAHRVTKTNTCYTGSLVFLNSGDTIKIIDIFNERQVLLDSVKSFFGLVRISGGVSAHHMRPITSTTAASNN